MLRGTGDPLLDLLLDLEIYQDSSIAKFCFSGKTWEEPLVLDPHKIKNYSKHIPSLFQTYFNLIGCTYAFRVWEYSFESFRFCKTYQDSTIVLESPARRRLFWTQGNHPEIMEKSKFPKSHLVFCHGYWHHISTSTFMFLLDIGLISMILNILLNGSSSFVGARLFPK